jgi:hypothetical protein
MIPWPALDHMLKLIDSVRDKDAYLLLEQDGNNLIELLPGGLTQRAPQQVERFAVARIAESVSWGETLPTWESQDENHANAI